MNREDFHAEIRNGHLRNCYLFEGEEEYTKSAALKALREQVLRGEFASLNESVLVNPSADIVIAHADTLPFLAEKRFILIKESVLLSGKSSAADDAAEAQETRESPDADALLAYLQRLPDTVCLVFYVRGRVNGTRKLCKHLAKLGALVSFEVLDQRMMVKWIARELKRFGKTISHEAADLLILSAGQDMYVLSGEIGKLAAYAGERENISAQDIDAICTKSAEYRVFDLSEALSQGQAGRCTRLMEDMLREGEQRLMLLALLQRHYRQLLFAKLLDIAGKQPDAVAKAIGVPGFIARKILSAVSRYPADVLKSVYELLVNTEFEVKSGQLPEEGSLEQAVFRILAMQEGMRNAQ